MIPNGIDIFLIIAQHVFAILLGFLILCAPLYKKLKFHLVLIQFIEHKNNIPFS